MKKKTDLWHVLIHFCSKNEGLSYFVLWQTLTAEFYNTEKSMFSNEAFCKYHLIKNFNSHQEQHHKAPSRFKVD